MLFKTKTFSYKKVYAHDLHREVLSISYEKK